MMLPCKIEQKVTFERWFDLAKLNHLWHKLIIFAFDFKSDFLDSFASEHCLAQNHSISHEIVQKSQALSYLWCILYLMVNFSIAEN